ncbi:sigma-54 interaction domain-containing protein [Stigmatella erecta]|uniref:Transcriptional regulator containing PAS, AAA-type ATPase, and DNA-binding Fis domains n=1 Tax=Stigmatella erecta TaxID=83460 RepID=A0A1I0GJ58_9BACT|nr:sigma 54-interacting transcriptional regulator [Stigmatella erecta]SET71051.1 Transcriptional regulator containing PAS, AAA-type ATPase, and DNA-binding Fis domains [Stigmatella erecta]
MTLGGDVPLADALKQSLRALEAFSGPTVLLDAQTRVLALGAQATSLLKGRLKPGQRLLEAFEADPAETLRTALKSHEELCLTFREHAGPGAPRALRLRATDLMEGPRGVGWAVHLSLPPAEPEAAEELFHGLWTQDPHMRRLFRTIERAARTEASVLVRGESGTGKELTAHALHALSSRAKGPFRAINCAALSPSLLESELFGHVRGAFTGAVRDSPGHFRLAGGGTLFLDEVAELPLELQAKLLRALETHSVIPVGGREPISVDVRIVAATHRALRREVEQGRFRADLMYRLRVVPLFLPSLRERPGDILPLARRFLKDLNARGGRQVLRFSAQAQRQLQEYPWPGNVRELRNVMEYAHVMGEGPVLSEAELPPEFNEQAHPAPRASESAQRSTAPVGVEDIHRALSQTQGNRARAAALLGISRITLWRRLRQASEGAER